MEFRKNLKIWLNFVHSFLRYGAKQQQIIESIMFRNSVTNFVKNTIYNTNIDLVNMICIQN